MFNIDPIHLNYIINKKLKLAWGSSNIKKTANKLKKIVNINIHRLILLTSNLI